MSATPASQRARTSTKFRGASVITSYSIHYTKLYEVCPYEAQDYLDGSEVLVEPVPMSYNFV